MNFVRTFIAIELPAPIRQYLFQAGQQMIDDSSPKDYIRWVPSENIHLTLRFLGDTAEEKVNQISAAIDAIAHEFNPFSLYFDHLGGFPNQKRPRIIWAGLAGELPTLNALQSRIEKSVQGLGWSREKRPFRPHLTLGRVKDPNQAYRLSWTNQFEKKEFLVSEIVLIESKIEPQGPVYTTRHRSHLK